MVARSRLGKTLNSTGRVMYIETSRITVEIVMLALMSRSIRNAGSGAIIAIIALGYTMVYGIMGLINFAHGEIFMAGAFFGLLAAYYAGSLCGDWSRASPPRPSLPASRYPSP